MPTAALCQADLSRCSNRLPESELLDHIVGAGENRIRHGQGGLAHQPLEPKTVSIKLRTCSSGKGAFVINRQKKMAPSSAKAAISGSM
jgi:hypothetical protein